MSAEAAAYTRAPLPAQPGNLAWPTAAWPRAELDARIDATALDVLLDGAFHAAGPLGQTNALLVVQRGEVVVERYADGVSEDDTHISWSMAKSILHAVIGVLVRQGGLDVLGGADVPEWGDPADPRRAITIDPLLRMRSGLQFVEDYVDAGTSDVIDMLFGEGKSDVAAYAARSSLEHPPGEVWSYSSGTSNLLSAIAGRQVGGPGRLRPFVERELLRPLGMRSATLREDAAGTWIASSFVHATAQDFARFGLLYLRDGVWNGQRLLPEGWVDHARAPIATPDSEPHDYGAHFWVVPDDLGTFQAQGYNGQRLTLVPGLDLIVVRLGVTPESGAEALNDFMRQLVDSFRVARA
jgi:CubicO group peptidase (beta-lactamase class C family)